jgi:hypothetical protein
VLPHTSTGFINFCWITCIIDPETKAAILHQQPSGQIISFRTLEPDDGDQIGTVCLGCFSCSLEACPFPVLAHCKLTKDNETEHPVALGLQT